ncbi:MAG: TerC family protein [Negativicutes bacterium]|nr:TerC family protein [Negativicutes bacterium]
MEFLIALCGIMMVNVVLSGDNAVVIAMASRALPPKQQKMAIIWGSVGAIALRVVLTFAALILLKIPYLQFGGGLLLVWIAAKLLLEEKAGEEAVEASSSLWSAIKTIVVADIVMSLDNTLAIASIANGNVILLITGLVLSIPLIMFGSSILVKLMDRFPVIVYIGAALIAWTAGEMMVDDHRLGVAILEYLPHWLLPVLITAGVLGFGIWHKRRRSAAMDAVGVKMERMSE